MSRWHNQYPDGHAFFCTMTVTDWQPLLGQEATAALYEEWEKARNATGTRILAFCVMPNHIHILAGPEQGASTAGLSSDPGGWAASSYRQVTLGEEAVGFRCDALGEILL
jgi:REP element-mobilizing transposase RayT